MRLNGFGPLLAQPGKFHTLREFFPVFVPSLTAMIGYWATLSLNMPDFTRFGRSQREQMVGHIADYWIVRRCELRLEDLYLAGGVYRGWNWRAIAATAVGCAFAWGGLVIPQLKPLYDYAWFVGFFVAGTTHLALAPRMRTTLGAERAVAESQG